MGRVLVVDDEESILTYLTMALEDHGHEALAAADAIVALEILEQTKVDLITLDIMMPKRSGIAFYCDLRHDPRYAEVPVVFVSGFSQLCDVGTEHSFRKLVPDTTVPRPSACMEKPVELRQFLEMVDGIVGEPNTAGTEAREI